jgi:dTDP-4-dehydrorhamnose 3,5-epimerase
MEFTDGPIDGVIVRPLRLFRDERGWLAEVFRRDEPAAGPLPAMAYISETLPGVARGPHEHVEQTDTFAFAGPSNFRLWLWDNRADSPTYRRRTIVAAGQERPTVVVVPPGVVHAYRNVGAVPGLVFNCPDALYKGPGRGAPVDEIRHEDDPDSPFRAE